MSRQELYGEFAAMMLSLSPKQINFGQCRPVFRRAPSSLTVMSRLHVYSTLRGLKLILQFEPSHLDTLDSPCMVIHPS